MHRNLLPKTLLSETLSDAADTTQCHAVRKPSGTQQGISATIVFAMKGCGVYVTVWSLLTAQKRKSH